MFFRNFILFLICATVVSCKEYVPVLIWSTQTNGDSYTDTSALSKLSTNEFSNYLLKRVKAENPLILVFMEENLSVEDFSWRDVNENSAFPLVRNITKQSEDVSFLPSVHNPYKALKNLRNHGYAWKYFDKENLEVLKESENMILDVKLEEPDFLEDRPDLLKGHDEQIAKLYNEAIKYKPNVMVIYSGNHTAWIDSELERFKREEKDSAENGTTIVIAEAKGTVRMTATSPILFYSKTEYVITKLAGDPTSNEANGKINMTVKFLVADRPVSFKFTFTSEGDKWWTLESIDVDEHQVYNLKSSEPVGGPSGYSYFCNPTVKFVKDNTSLIFENFQVQPRVGEKNLFGPVIHCIPFFSIGIWSGIVIVIILSIVLAWGIVMIMDINTNDRFDDPKGKTITITATD